MKATLEWNLPWNDEAFTQIKGKMAVLWFFTKLVKSLFKLGAIFQLYKCQIFFCDIMCNMCYTKFISAAENDIVPFSKI